MPDSPLLLVTGATGAVGPAVVSAAHSHGWGVRTLSRRPPEAGIFPPGVDIRTGDIGDPAAVRAALEGTGVVLHLAGLLHVVGAPETMKAEYERVNVQATGVLAREAAAMGTRRLVMFSTVAVYGDRGDRIVDEDTSAVPDTEYARTKLRAEQSVLLQSGRDGMPLGVVLRLAAVYGPRVRGNYRTLVRMLARRRFVSIGPGLNRRTLVFDEDVAQAALLAAFHPAAAGRVFNVTDACMPTVREVIEAVCAALDRPPPGWSVPLAPIQVLLGAATSIAPRFGPTRRLEAMVSKYTQHVAVDGTRIQRELGFAPRVGLLEGWRRTVAGLKDAGDV